MTPILTFSDFFVTISMHCYKLSGLTDLNLLPCGSVDKKLDPSFSKFKLIIKQHAFVVDLGVTLSFHHFQHLDTFDSLILAPFPLLPKPIA